MELRRVKLLLRRRVRHQQRQVETFGQATERVVEQHFFKRLNRFASVRRFVISWTGLIVILLMGLTLQNFNLSNYYQTLRPVDGGVYREGVVGTFSTANPLFSVSDVDNAAARLLFAGLFHYDDNNRLVGDLATAYDVDVKGTTYTVHLRPDLQWHDGKPLTSADVLFTYNAIQNPDAQSPLISSWRGVSITAPDPATVVFKLTSPLASFPQNLTNGIVPQHILGSVPAAELRTADFNTVHPVGAGPFMWRAIQVTGTDPSNAEEQLALVPFARYHGGKPRLDQFVLHAYADRQAMIAAFTNNELTAVAGLSKIPPEFNNKPSVEAHNMPLTAGTYTFFKMTHPVLGNQKVRQALVQATDQASIIKQLNYPSRPVRGPLLNNQLAYDNTLLQPKYDLATARTILQQDGWTADTKGRLNKAGQLLAFSLTATDTPEYRTVVNELQKNWKALGVDLQVRFLNNQDFQNALSYHDYDAVLYGISIGTDPDVYVYWDSSQADIRSANRLNLSEYKNATADTALEAGRTRFDPALRVVKYRPFLQAWQQDLPAVGLYQPRVLYITNTPVAGFTDHTVNSSTERYSNVHNWQIRQAKVTN